MTKPTLPGFVYGEGWINTGRGIKEIWDNAHLYRTTEDIPAEGPLTWENIELIPVKEEKP